MFLNIFPLEEPFGKESKKNKDERLQCLLALVRIWERTQEMIELDAGEEIKLNSFLAQLIKRESENKNIQGNEILFSLLMMCTGNYHRSPIAEGYAEKFLTLLGLEHRVKSYSRGTLAPQQFYRAMPRTFTKGDFAKKYHSINDLFRRIHFDDYVDDPELMSEEEINNATVVLPLDKKTNDAVADKFDVRHKMITFGTFYTVLPSHVKERIKQRIDPLANHWIWRHRMKGMTSEGILPRLDIIFPDFDFYNPGTNARLPEDALIELVAEIEIESLIPQIVSILIKEFFPEKLGLLMKQERRFEPNLILRAA